MSIEAVEETKFRSPNGLKFKSGRRAPRLQKIPSPLYCTFFLIICITFGELFEGFVLRRLAANTSHNLLVFYDIFSMIVVILPAFYLFVYRPMKLYEQTKVDSEKEIKFLSRQLIILGDKEKRAVARDLHDQFGQALSVLQFSMETLKASVPDMRQEQRALCENLVETIAELGDTVRNISTYLSPAQLDDSGLIPTLEWAVQDIQEKGASFNVDFEISGTADRLPYRLEITLYRIFQEALNNIVTHAQASRVKISLQENPAQVNLSIQDNGIGFESPLPVNRENIHRGIGLLGMRERVEALGGSFALETSPGKGTTVQVSIPKPSSDKASE